MLGPSRHFLLCEHVSWELPQSFQVGVRNFKNVSSLLRGSLGEP